MIDKNKMPLAVGIAFVAFTTQFGGGFASGNQLIQYFVDYGMWSLVLPLLAQGLLAFFFWYGLRYAYANKIYDYRSFSDSFYGKYGIIFSNLFEIVYLILIGTATSAAFATGGATLERLLVIPYWICTVIVGVFIFIVAMYGTNIVRKCASTLSVLIIIGLLIVLVPNIIVQWDIITSNIASMAGGKMPVSSIQTGALAPAVGKAVLYFLFQLASVGLMYQHVKPCTSEKQIDRAAIYMFIVNTFTMVLIVVGMCAIVYLPGLINDETSKLIDVPMILFVEEGIGAVVLKPVISILIILGSVSTGVNMIAGIVTRCVNQVCKKENEDSYKRKLWSIIFSVIFTLFSLVVAQTGLGAIVNTGYKWLGWSACVVVGIPYILHMITHIGKKSFNLQRSGC